MDFKGCHVSNPRKVAETLLQETENSLSFAFNIYKIARVSSLKTIEYNQLAILDGWDYNDAPAEIQEKYDFWNKVRSELINLK